jgi:hypothetical protein
MCGRQDFKKMLEGKVKDLYIGKLRDYHTGIPGSEIKYFLKEKKTDIDAIILSRAGEFWHGREDGPTQVTFSLTKKPYINDLIQNFDTIEAEIQTPYEEKTIKPVKQPVTFFIGDPSGSIIKDLEEHGPSFVKDTTECNKVILKIFKYLEGDMKFAYGRDQDNFGYEELWLTPSQVLSLKKSPDDRMKEKEIDCEDMHNYGATCLEVAGVPEFRYRCVAGVGHLTLFALSDGLETWRNLEFTPDYKNLHTFTIRSLPKFGDPKNSMHKRKILFSYNGNDIFSTFNALPTRNDFEGFVKDIKEIEFPQHMFEIQ